MHEHERRDHPAGMKRVASVIRLRPEKAEEYRALHAAVWPAVQERIRASNITNYSIFLRDGLLFAYFEYVGEDLDRDLAVLDADPETQRWLALTDPCQQDPDGEDGRPWRALTEIWHLGPGPRSSHDERSGS